MGASLPAAGTVLAGKYRIVRVLGQGGMGIVYEAQHLRLHQRLAIKMLLPEFGDDVDLVARFEREARASAKLESDRVTKVLDVDTSPDGLPYIVMEFLEGHDLEAEIHERKFLPIAEAVAIIMEACVPIAEAHAKGIVHRDLKPSNLFLHKKDGERRLKLLDFGISKVTADTDTRVTSSFQSLGTPVYMSPEQVRRSKNIDGRTDIWSLGIILYEMVTGTVPYNEESASAVIAAIAADPITPPGMHRLDLPAELEVVIMRALAKDPAKRFKDVKAFAAALAPFAPEEELVAFTAIEAASGRRSIPDLDSDTLPPPPPSVPRRTPPTLPMRVSPAPRISPAPYSPGPPRVTPVTSTQPLPTTTPHPASTSMTSPPSHPPDSGHVSGSWTHRPPPPPSRWKPIVLAVGLIGLGVVITLAVLHFRKPEETAKPAASSVAVMPPAIVPTATTSAIASASATVSAAPSARATAATATAAPTWTGPRVVKPAPSAAPSASADNPLTL